MSEETRASLRELRFRLDMAGSDLARAYDALAAHEAQVAREADLNWFRATLDRMLGRSR